MADVDVLAADLKLHVVWKHGGKAVQHLQRDLIHAEPPLHPFLLHPGNHGSLVDGNLIVEIRIDRIVDAALDAGHLPEQIGRAHV